MDTAVSGPLEKKPDCGHSHKVIVEVASKHLPSGSTGIL